jgi:hypothetical protein
VAGGDNNQFLALIPAKICGQMTEPEISAFSLLDEVVLNSKAVEHIGGGILLARKENAEARLDVMESLIWSFNDDYHLSITVGNKNFPKERKEVCVAYGDKPFADNVASFVRIADVGWPEKHPNGEVITPEPLIRALDWANHLHDTYGTPAALAAAREAERAEAQRQAILAERAEAQRLVALQAERKERLMIEQIIQARQFAKFCAGDLVDLTNEASYVKDFWEAAYSDSMEGINFTNDLLMRGVSAAVECINSGFNTGDVIDAIRFFLDWFSPLTINANLRSLGNNGPEARILRLYKC